MSDCETIYNNNRDFPTSLSRSAFIVDPRTSVTSMEVSAEASWTSGVRLPARCEHPSDILSLLLDKADRDRPAAVRAVEVAMGAFEDQ